MNKFINDASQLTWRVQHRVTKCQVKTEVQGRPSSKILGSSARNEHNVGLKGKGRGVTWQDRTVGNGQWKTKLKYEVF